MDPEPHRKLMEKAGRLLARRAYARGELAQRLARAADAEAVAAVLDRLAQLGLLNDANYAYNFGFQRVAREGWGARRVRGDLIARRVEPEVADAALARVFEAVGEEESLAAYLDRYSRKRGWPSDRPGIRRLVMHLERRGFPDEVIYRSLRRRIDSTAWRQFESGD
jgi:regulatory protein